MHHNRITRASIGLMAVALLALLMATACGGPSTPAPAGPTPPPAVGQTPAAPATTGAVPQPATPAAAQPKRGGTLVIRYWTGDPPDLDPYLNTSFRSQEFAAFFYSRLLKFDSGPDVKPNSFKPIGDLADKWEVSKDGLTWTFHIRDNAKWQNKPPLNGRKVTADDVMFSWTRFQKDNVQKAVLNMVKDVKAVDASNVAFTLNDIFAPFETSIATPLFYIVPKEVIDADGNLRKTIVGSGPFIFDKYEKGVQVVAKRNPDYYFSPMPYVDEVDLLIVPEDATAVAAMRSKQIDINGVSAIDAASLSKTNPEMLIRKNTQNLLSFMYWRVQEKPFNDARVRQAVSLAMDRDETIKTLYEGEGVYQSHLAAGLESSHLSPLDASFGPNAKYFKRDVAAAKKLLADAGYPDGLKVPYISVLNAYGNTFNQGVELVQKQLKDAGIIMEFKPQDYSAYIASTFLGKFEAPTMVWGLETPVQEANDYLFNMYDPKSARNHAGINDEKLNAMIVKQRMTLDKTERKNQLYEIQRYLAEQQYYVIGTVGMQMQSLQPWVKNFYYETDYGRGAEYVIKVWLDGKPQ
ncbi:MAG: ABC transporter substrate-binding protein [Chloroflexi bacterium]|nr:ABC transporter substrate-binding protein [Chloroflexota bacterium]